LSLWQRLREQAHCSGLKPSVWPGSALDRQRLAVWLPPGLARGFAGTRQLRALLPEGVGWRRVSVLAPTEVNCSIVRQPSARATDRAGWRRSTTASQSVSLTQSAHPTQLGYWVVAAYPVGGLAWPIVLVHRYPRPGQITAAVTSFSSGAATVGSGHSPFADVKAQAERLGCAC